MPIQVQATPVEVGSLQTKAQKALALPEILEVIFGFLADDKATLYQCVQVNRMWLKEAARVLWSRVGCNCMTDGDLDRPSHRTHPLIIYLAGMLLDANAEHVHLYAKSIESLKLCLWWQCDIQQAQTSEEHAEQATKCPKKVKESMDRLSHYRMRRNPRSVLGKGMVWEEEYLSALFDVKFPRLKHLTISSPRNPLLLKPFLTSNLRSLVVRSDIGLDQLFSVLMVCEKSSIISLGCPDTWHTATTDSCWFGPQCCVQVHKRFRFLRSRFWSGVLTVRQQCAPPLTRLEIHRPVLNVRFEDPTDMVFVQLIRSMQSLTHFLNWVGWSDNWNGNATIHELARLPRLKQLILPDTPLGHIRAPKGWTPDTFFAELKSLHLRGRMADFEAVKPWFTHIQRLVYTLRKESISTTLPSMTGFGRLRSLIFYVEFDLRGRPVIKAAQLMQLSRDCPELRRLDLPDNRCLPGVFRPRAFETDDITDQTIEDFSQGLPHLEHFRLFIHNSQLTCASVISLGRRCKKLKHLGIAANINVLELTERGTKSLFPELKGLTIHPRLTQPQQVQDEIAVLSSLATMFPKVPPSEFWGLIEV